MFRYLSVIQICLILWVVASSVVSALIHLSTKQCRHTYFHFRNRDLHKIACRIENLMKKTSKDTSLALLLFAIGLDCVSVEVVL